MSLKGIRVIADLELIFQLDDSRMFNLFRRPGCFCLSFVDGQHWARIARDFCGLAVDFDARQLLLTPDS